jgi:hypothetical protein
LILPFSPKSGQGTEVLHNSCFYPVLFWTNVCLLWSVNLKRICTDILFPALVKGHYVFMQFSHFQILIAVNTSNLVQAQLFQLM